VQIQDKEAAMSGPFEGKFCNSPFEYCYIDQTGDVFVCCPSAVPVVIGNLLSSDWEQVWNSETARMVRRTILEGSFAQCRAEHCPYLELGMRITPRGEVPDPYYRELMATRNTRVNRGPKEVNIAYDATCNLSCPYCREEVFGAKGTAAGKAQTLHDKIWSGPLLDCEILTMAGNGDAFASRFYRDALRNFDAAKYPKMKIQVVTNGLLLTPAMWESVEAAHGAIRWINVSINAASPESFARNQRGGDFQTLLTNLEHLRAVRQSGVLPWLTFSFIVQTNNYREMPEFVHLGKKYGADPGEFHPFGARARLGTTSTATRRSTAGTTRRIRIFCA
jgi:MoaA/NifB/PqqE/SkfB family radical SAM enzyme